MPAELLGQRHDRRGRTVAHLGTQTVEDRAGVHRAAKRLGVGGDPPGGGANPQPVRGRLVRPVTQRDDQVPGVTTGEPQLLAGRDEVVLTAGMQEPAIPSPRRGTRVRDGQDPAATFDVGQELPGFLQGSDGLVVDRRRLRARRGLLLAAARWLGGPLSRAAGVGVGAVLEVVAAVLGQRCLPGRSMTADRHQAPALQRCRGGLVPIALRRPPALGASIGDPLKHFELACVDLPRHARTLRPNSCTPIWPPGPASCCLVSQQSGGSPNNGGGGRDKFTSKFSPPGAPPQVRGHARSGL